MATAARMDRQERLAQWRDGVKRFLKRSGAVLAGAAIVTLALLAGVAMVSYHPSDPSLNTAAAGPVLNWAGPPGAFAADLLLSLWGTAGGTAAAVDRRHRPAP